MSIFTPSFFSAIVVLILFCVLTKGTALAGEQVNSASKTSQDHYPAIVLDQETQKISGVQTTKSRLVNYQSEFIVFGKAVNIAPLLALRHQYWRALTESKSAKARFTQSEQRIKRTRDLYSHGVAAKRSLQEQQSQWRADQAQVEAAHFQIEAILDEARLNWGNQLTDWIMAADFGKFEPFLSGRQIMLQITLPSDRQLDEDTEIIFVEPSGNRGKAQPARLISPAPKIDNTIQGDSYFFQTEGKAIKTGMNVSAWIPWKQRAKSGVIVPKSAVIWSMDQSFVYIKSGAEKFERRTIETTVPANDGYLVSESIKPGEYIVTSGGQMLWSEEMRGQIPDENE